MKRKSKVIVTSRTTLVLLTALAVYLVWGRNRLEIQVRKTRRSPDGKWTAVVQMEVYSAPAFMDDAVYAVRLKGPAQKDSPGDLVMNVPVNYPDHDPSIEWSEGKLVVTLTDHQKYQFLANPVDGVPIAVQQQ